MQAALHIIPTFMWWDIIDFIDISSMIIIIICINGHPNNSSWSPNWNNQDEFAGPKELADYLLKLDKDDEAYNQYFKWKVRLYHHQHWCFVQNHPIDWLESLCLNHYDVDKRQKILVSSSVHGIAYLYDQCCFQGTHTYDVSRVRGSLSTPGSSAECVLWCITHRFVLINMIFGSWFSSSSSRSLGSHHHYLVIGSHYHYLGHHLNDFKSYFSYFRHTPHLRVFGPCL